MGICRVHMQQRGAAPRLGRARRGVGSSITFFCCCAGGALPSRVRQYIGRRPDRLPQFSVPRTLGHDARCQSDHQLKNGPPRGAHGRQIAVGERGGAGQGWSFTRRRYNDGEALHTMRCSVMLDHARRCHATRCYRAVRRCGACPLHAGSMLGCSVVRLLGRRWPCWPRAARQ